MTHLKINQNLKGLVRVDGIWRSVHGEKRGYDFYYILNGKLNVAFDGNFYAYGNDISQREVDNEAIRLNIHDMRRGTRRR